MALPKVTYTDNVTHISASNMNAIQDEIISHGSRVTALESRCDIYYGTSTNSQSARTVSIQAGDSFTLRTGAFLAVKFTYSKNSGSSTMSLNVNSGGAKTIYRCGTTTAVGWKADQVVLFMYDGTYWQQISAPAA